MRSVKFLVAAGAASLLSSVAFAADMPSIMPPPPMNYAPPPVEDFGGWYLRGDIGMTNQRVDSLALTTSPPAGFQSTGMGFDSSMLYDLGVGYRFNNWLRADVTGQYRGAANFHGSQFSTVGTLGPGISAVDNYTASKSEWVAMVNGYVDLGTWWCITPFVGAGVGTSRNTISGFRDDGIFNNGGQGISSTFGATASKWNFAWALHAGVAYNITRNVALELAYSYMNLGDGVTGPTNSFDGVTVVNQSGFTFKNITSNDVKLGVRWQFDAPPVYQPPLMTKG
jgi:opacity protein-like surface antigen